MSKTGDKRVEGKRPMTLLQAFGYCVAATLAMVGCMAIQDYARDKRSSPESIASEKQRVSQEAAAATKKAQDAVRACANDDVEAFVMSHDHVRAALKAPGTAKFPSITTPGVKTAYLGNCTHDIRAFVDAQNSFGAMLRSPYSARLKKDPTTGRWKLVSLSLQGQ